MIPKKYITVGLVVMKRVNWLKSVLIVGKNIVLIMK